MNSTALTPIPNILIVDDIEENILYIESVIKNFHFNIIRAMSGNEALEKIKGLDLVMAVIDVRMPGMNGYELAEQINGESAANKVPIIFITANIFSEIEELKGYNAGAVDYIYKPFSSQILKGKVSIFLDLYNQRQTILRNAVKIKENKEKYKKIMNASPDGIVLIDLSGYIKEVSEIGLELLGADYQEAIIGRHYKQFVIQDAKRNVKDIIASTITDGFTQFPEATLLKIDNTPFLGEVSATLIQGPKGIPLSILVVIRDISQRKKIIAAQIHGDRMASLGQMAAGMAHEINQPLNIISMVVDKLLFDANKNQHIDLTTFNEKSEKIFENLTRIRNIIDHIRVFSRSNVDYIPIAFNINFSILNAVSMISQQFKHLGIELEVALGEQLPRLIGNTYQFEQVMINLLTNAKDAIIEKTSLMPDFTDFKIRISTFIKREQLIIEVQDNGIGIKEEDLHEIFIPFFSTKEEGKGTGLGLSICYQIIKDMGGDLNVTSVTHQMTKVQLTFDLNKIQYAATT